MAAVPSLANPDSRSVSQPSSQALPLQSLRAHLDVLSSLQSARQALLDNLERQIKSDDSLPSLRAEHDRLVSVLRAKGSESEIRLDAFEVCFELGLSKFERFRIGIKESQARQQDVLDLIRVSSSPSRLVARSVIEPRANQRPWIDRARTPRSSRLANLIRPSNLDKLRCKNWIKRITSLSRFSGTSRRDSNSTTTFPRSWWGY